MNPSENCTRISHLWGNYTDGRERNRIPCQRHARVALAAFTYLSGKIMRRMQIDKTWQIYTEEYMLQSTPCPYWYTYEMQNKLIFRCGTCIHFLLPITWLKIAFYYNRFLLGN